MAEPNLASLLSAIQSSYANFKSLPDAQRNAFVDNLFAEANRASVRPQDYIELLSVIAELAEERMPPSYWGDITRLGLAANFERMVTTAQKTKFIAEVCKMTRNPTLGSDGFFGWKFADLVSNSDAARLSIALQTAVQKLPHAQQRFWMDFSCEEVQDDAYNLAQHFVNGLRLSPRMQRLFRFLVVGYGGLGKTAFVTEAHRGRHPDPEARKRKEGHDLKPCTATFEPCSIPYRRTLTQAEIASGVVPDPIPAGEPADTPPFISITVDFIDSAGIIASDKPEEMVAFMGKMVDFVGNCQSSPNTYIDGALWAIGTRVSPVELTWLYTFSQLFPVIAICLRPKNRIEAERALDKLKTGQTFDSKPPPLYDTCVVHARDEEEKGSVTSSRFGMSALGRLLARAMNDKGSEMKGSFEQKTQSQSRKVMLNRARAIIASFVALAGGGGAIPIPLLDDGVVISAQVGMVAALCVLYKVKLSSRTVALSTLKAFATSGVVVGSLYAVQFALSLSKFIPVVGIASSAIYAATASLVTTGLGFTVVKVLDTLTEDPEYGNKKPEDVEKLIVEEARRTGKIASQKVLDEEMDKLIENAK